MKVIIPVEVTVEMEAGTVEEVIKAVENAWIYSSPTLYIDGVDVIVDYYAMFQKAEQA